MRVLIVVTKGTLGGAQRYVFDIASAAKKRGIKVTVAHGTGGWLGTELDRIGVKRITLPHLGRDVKVRNDLAAFVELWQVISRERPEVLHLNSSKVAAMGAFIGRLRGVPRVITTVHGWAFHEHRNSFERFAIFLIQWLATLLSHQSIVISYADVRAGQRMPWCKRKITLIHNGVEQFGHLAKQEARGALSAHARNIPRDALWVGTVAELTRNKGLDILIRAFDEFARKNVNAHLVVVGEGELWGTLTAQARDSHATKRIHLVSLKHQAAREILSAFDIFVLSSRKEGLPYALLEAGRAALPVIATRVGGNSDIIEHGASGLLVPPEDPHALASELSSLAPNVPMRVAFGRALQSRVGSLFTLSRMAEETFALYER